MKTITKNEIKNDSSTFLKIEWNNHLIIEADSFLISIN